MSQILIMLFVLLSFMSAELSAKYSRKEAKKNEAIKIIRENSEEVSILAGVDPLSSDSLQSLTVEENQIGDLGEDIEELEIEDDVEIDFETFNMLWLAFVAEDDEDIYTDNGIHKEEMMDFVMEWLGTPYRFGGDSPRGIDCSAFTRRAYRNILGIEIPRTANYQYAVGEEIPIEDLEFGDLVFFRTRYYAPITHVGIYLGDDLFAHASSRNGVTVSSLTSGYYSRKYRGAKRLTLDDFRELEIVTDENEEPTSVGG